MTDVSRRDFLKSAALGAVGAFSIAAAPQQSPRGWEDVPSILSRIRAPAFPPRKFIITNYGALAGGIADCRSALLKAVSACHKSGGGTVVVPSGVFLSNGPIHLKSNVRLYLSKGATLRFGTNPNDYLPPVFVRWEGTRCLNYSPLLYAFQQKNIAIAGPGTIDGQASAFWGTWRKKQHDDMDTLRKMGSSAVSLAERVFGEGHYLRPDLIQFHGCRNVAIEDITIKDSPFWTIHPVLCSNVTVRGVHVLPGPDLNDDGLNPESCRDVLIERCTFETNDDNIAIKSGRDRDAWGQPPSENIIIRDCHFVRTGNGLCIGSEMSAGVRNVFFERCKMDEVGIAFYIKSNSERGGAIENIWVRNVLIASCNTVLQLRTDYHGVADGPHPPIYRNLNFSGIQCREAKTMGISSVGVKSSPIVDLRLTDVTIDHAGKEKEIENTENMELKRVKINEETL